MEQENNNGRGMKMLEAINVMLDKYAYVPERAHEWDAGLDLRSPFIASICDGESVVIDTGVHVQIPEGYVGMLKSKSGLNIKHGITSEGVVDAGYTGSIIVKLYRKDSTTKEPYQIEMGDKITQLVILPCETPKVNVVDEFPTTDRNDGGFGSTGR